jgi:hypothetical protein
MVVARRVWGPPLSPRWTFWGKTLNAGRPLPKRAPVARARLTLGWIIKERSANYLRLELSVAEVVANSYKKFGQMDGRLPVEM